MEEEREMEAVPPMEEERRIRVPLTDEEKRARNAERSRLRYARLTPEQKRARNARTALLQRLRKQRQRNMKEQNSVIQSRSTEEPLSMEEETEQEATAPLLEEETEQEAAAPSMEEETEQEAAAPLMEEEVSAPSLTAEERRIRNSERARLRYARLTPEQKKARNDRCKLLQKRRKQRQREMKELEEMLYASGDMYHDVHVLDRYSKLGEALHLLYDQSPIAAEEPAREEALLYDYGEPVEDVEVQTRKARKRIASRTRYHRMTPEEKMVYNRQRAERGRQKRQEELELLNTPIDEVTEEILEKARKMTERKLRRAAAARQRYHRMTFQQKKEYNKKRTKPKLKSADDTDLAQEEEVMEFEEGAHKEMMDVEDAALVKEENPFYVASPSDPNEYIYDIPKFGDSGYFFDVL